MTADLGWNIDRKHPPQVLWLTADTDKAAGIAARWKSEGGTIPPTQLMLITEPKGWLIRSGSCEWTVTRDGWNLKVHEANGLGSRTGRAVRTGQNWDDGTLEIGDKSYFWSQDTVDGIRLCLSDGTPILTDNPPWKDSDAKRGIARITTLLRGAEHLPELPMLAGFAFCRSFLPESVTHTRIGIDIAKLLGSS